MYADLALINGKVYSPIAGEEILRGEAVLVKEGIIKKVCSNEEAYEYIDKYTEVIDCKGILYCQDFAMHIAILIGRPGYLNHVSFLI
ncbi:MAG: hypothetical protein ACLVJQ_03165 [Lentihominibacter sp.]